MFLRIERTAGGSLGLGGPLVPAIGNGTNGGRRIESGASIASDALADTGYPCRLEKQSEAFIITGPPAGIVNVGGYRFVTRELEEVMSRFENNASIAALPDALAGYRLAGTGANRSMMREALSAIGVNPLIEGAFRERKAVPAPDAV